MYLEMFGETHCEQLSSIQKKASHGHGLAAQGVWEALLDLSLKQAGKCGILRPLGPQKVLSCGLDDSHVCLHVIKQASFRYQ